MKNRIIAFAGKAQAGKTESSKIVKDISESNGLIFKKISFATALKDIAEKYFDWDGDKGIYYYPSKFEKTHKIDDAYLPDVAIPDKGRQLLINIGKKFREIRPTIWADIAYKQILDFDKVNPENVIYCIDDMRFKNEVNIVRKYGNSTLIRVIRENGQLNIDDISEKDVDDVIFDQTVNNNGTLENLRDRVSEIYKFTPSGN